MVAPQDLKQLGFSHHHKMANTVRTHSLCFDSIIILSQQEAAT